VKAKSENCHTCHLPPATTDNVSLSCVISPVYMYVVSPVSFSCVCLSFGHILPLLLVTPCLCHSLLVILRMSLIQLHLVALAALANPFFGHLPPFLSRLQPTANLHLTSHISHLTPYTPHTSHTSHTSNLTPDH